MSSRQSRIPSPARSQGAVTPRRSRGRFSRSLGSPARSVASGRLSTIVSQFKNDNMNSFALSPVTGRSVLTDDTDIEEPRRKSWWKKLNDNSRDVIEALNTNQEPIMDNVVEELEVEILSQGKNNLTLDLPDSSGSESIGSIVLPQRKLFTQKENIPRNKDFGKIISRRDSTAKLQKTQIELQENIGPKKLFGQVPQKSIFPSNLINTSVNKTAVNVEPEVTSKKLFGTNKVSKSKSIFPNDFINTSTNKTLIDENAKAKNLFQRPVEKTKTVFPTALLTISPNKTIGNKTKELNNADVQVQARTLFGNRPGTKRKNMFADFIVAESEDELLEMQDQLFPFPKRSDNVGRASRISYATDLEMDDWKVLPSSTMMEQLEDMITTQVQDPEDDKEESAEHEPEEEVENSEVRKTRSVAEKGENEVINKSVAVDQYTERMEEVPESGINEQEGATDNSRVEKEAVESVAQQKDQGLVAHDKVEHMEVLKYIEESEVEEDSEVLEKEEEIDNVHKQEHGSKVGQDENQKVGNVVEEQIIDTSKVQEIEVVEQEEVLADVDESEVQEEADSEVPEDVEESEVENEMNESEGQEESLVEEEIEESEAEQELEVQDEQEQSEAEQNNSEVSENELHESEAQQEDIEKEDDGIEKDTVQVQEEINNTDVGEKEEIEKEINVTEKHKVQEQDVENRSEFGDKKVLEPEPEQQGIEEVEEEMQKEGRGAEEGDEVINNSEDQEHGDLQNEQEEIDAVQEESETEDQEDLEQMEVEEQEEVQEEENEESVAEEEIQEQEVENEQSDEQEEMDEANEHSDEQEEMEEENEQSEEQEEIEEENEQSDEEEDIDNSDVHEEQVIESEGEQEDASEAQEVESDENEAEIDDAEQELDEDRNNEPNDKSEYPNVTHDTTGRYRKKHNDSKVKSPEAVLRDKTNNENNSFEMQPQGRNTSVRKTKSMMKMSLAPSIRESLGVDGSKNSSAEGSGWDSHRVTKKTIRQTFGKDFTPRKSLRALVMEKSAQRQTFGNEYINPDSIKVPQANSTEINSDVSIPNDDDVVNTTEESDHEMSRRTRQTTLEMYLQKVKKDTLERKQKMESAVRSSLKVPSKDVLNHYNISSKPLGVRKSKPAVPKANNKVKPSAVPLGILPMEVLKDMQYKPPKRFMPSNASWITKRLYKFLETKLEPKYDYKARVRAEKLVETIYNFTKYVRRHDIAPRDIIDELKVEMARLDVVQTHYDFYDFFHEYMPREIRIKVVPDIHNRLPIPKQGVFTPIIREAAVRG